ncbi:MAG: sulfotransferase family protein [Gemmatimonadetes bacterium]|nr:MAG: sulfotransferase family protein [Gemmatimonadota bacterium]
MVRRFRIYTILSELPVYLMITVVSGLPRSGTSLMMQMLHAGGLSILTDNIRPPDENNPRGYFEYERVKALKTDNSWLKKAEGKAVKIISYLLPHLPLEYPYKIIFMERNLVEVYHSQQKMIRNLGQMSTAEKDKLIHTFELHLNYIKPWLMAQPRMSVLEVSHQDVLTQPEVMAHQIADFLEMPLAVDRMAAVVDPQLYRERIPS